jgi:hypothetical protein
LTWSEASKPEEEKKPEETCSVMICWVMTGDAMCSSYW